MSLLAPHTLRLPRSFRACYAVCAPHPPRPRSPVLQTIRSLRHPSSLPAEGDEFDPSERASHSTPSRTAVLTPDHRILFFPS